jgi:lysyl-tRNA synthetase class II
LRAENEVHKKITEIDARPSDCLAISLETGKPILVAQSVWEQVTDISALLEEMKKKLQELNVKYEGENIERLTDTLWKYCRKHIAGPAFLLHHPKLVAPLAKISGSNDKVVERFQVILAGSEIGNGYSELNDPIDQRERFEEQKLQDNVEHLLNLFQLVYDIENKMLTKVH